MKRRSFLARLGLVSGAAVVPGVALAEGKSASRDSVADLVTEEAITRDLLVQIKRNDFFKDGRREYSCLTLLVYDPRLKLYGCSKVTEERWKDRRNGWTDAQWVRFMFDQAEGGIKQFTSYGLQDGTLHETDYSWSAGKDGPA